MLASLMRSCLLLSTVLSVNGFSPLPNARNIYVGAGKAICAPAREQFVLRESTQVTKGDLDLGHVNDALNNEQKAWDLVNAMNSKIGDATNAIVETKRGVEEAIENQKHTVESAADDMFKRFDAFRTKVQYGLNRNG